jgi:hypothetical protein
MSDAALGLVETEAIVVRSCMSCGRAEIVGPVTLPHPAWGEGWWCDACAERAVEEGQGDRE